MLFNLRVESRSKQSELAEVNIAQFIANVVPLVSREFKKRALLNSQQFIEKYPAIAKSITTMNYGESGFRLYADNPEVFPSKSFTYTDKTGRVVNKKNYWKSSPIKALMQEFGYYPTNEYAKKRWSDHKPNEKANSNIARNKGYLRIAMITAADSLDSNQKLSASDFSVNANPDNYISIIEEIIPVKLQKLLTAYVTGRQLPSYLRGMALEASQRMSKNISKFGQVTMASDTQINIGVSALTEFKGAKEGIEAGNIYNYEEAHLRNRLSRGSDNNYPAETWSNSPFD